jgi:hypothetical protein
MNVIEVVIIWMLFLLQGRMMGGGRRLEEGYVKINFKIIFIKNDTYSLSETRLNSHDSNKI